MIQTQSRDPWSAEESHQASSAVPSATHFTASSEADISSASPPSADFCPQKTKYDHAAYVEEIVKIISNPPSRSGQSNTEILIARVAQQCAHMELEERIEYLKSIRQGLVAQKSSTDLGGVKGVIQPIVDIFNRQIDDLEDQLSDKREAEHRRMLSAVDISSKICQAITYRPSRLNKVWAATKSKGRKGLNLLKSLMNACKKFFRPMGRYAKVTGEFLIKTFFWTVFPVSMILLIYEVSVMNFGDAAGITAVLGGIVYAIAAIGIFLVSEDMDEDECCACMSMFNSIVGPALLITSIAFLFNPPINNSDNESDYVGVIYEQKNREGLKKVIKVIDTRRDSCIGFKLFPELFWNDNQIGWEVAKSATFQKEISVTDKTDSQTKYAIRFAFSREVDSGYVAGQNGSLPVKEFDEAAITARITDMCASSTEPITSQSIRKSFDGMAKTMPYLKLTLTDVKVTASKTLVTKEEWNPDENPQGPNGSQGSSQDPKQSPEKGPENSSDAKTPPSPPTTPSAPQIPQAPETNPAEASDAKATDSPKASNSRVVI